MKELLKFNVQENVAVHIIDLVEEYDITYMEACIMYSENSGIEIEAIAEYVKKSDLIKGNLELEAEQLNFIKKTRRLPI